MVIRLTPLIKSIFKATTKSSITNLLYELPHELLNDLRFRTLGNKEILGKCESWVETSVSGAPQSKSTQK